MRLLFHITPSNTYIIRLDGGTCAGPICTGPNATFVGFDAAHRADFVLPVGLPTANLPFSLEYTGGGVFRGTINGVSKTIDITDLGTFNANDFREVELRAQSNLAFDSGDAVAITASFTNVEVGDDGVAQTDVLAVPVSTYVYGASSAQVVGFSVDSATGSLTLLSPTAAATATIYGGVVHPSGQFLYGTTETSPRIHGFRVDPATGALTAVPGSIYTGLGFDADIDLDGRFLYVAATNDTNVRGFAIDATTGALAELANSPFAGPARSLGLKLDPSGQFLYAADFNGGRLYAYTRDSVTGDLTAIAGSTFTTGAGPLNVAVDPAGQFVYSTAFNAAVIDGFRIDTGTGALTPLSGSPYATGSGPWGIVAHPNGKFVYVATQGGFSLHTYSVNSTTGDLTAAGTVTLSNTLRYLSVNSAGTYLFVPNTSGLVHVFAVDPTAGALSEITGSPFATGVTDTSTTLPVEYLG